MEKILFDKAHSVAFTGHRFISMDRQNELKQSLQAAIIEHYQRGIHNCICGMALGFDMMVADMVLSLKSRLPYIHLTAVVPFRNQSEKWSDKQKAKYNYLLSHADRIIILSEQYYKGCLLRRNDYMVNNSCGVITYYNGERKGGTFYTYMKAMSLNIPIVNIIDT
jgi:uncharacterized phage-like protein YoqJ